MLMLSPLRNRAYRHLFTAQVIALLGTGLATVALGLLAYDLAGAEAGRVLATALMIKMIAYVSIPAVASAFAERLPRRGLLIALDGVRALIVLALPFVDQAWQIYGLIFLLQSASAAFTPTFQATIPDILPDETEYTKALSLSRLAYDLENLLSPALAAALLTMVSFHWLFAATSLAFVLSALLVWSVAIPAISAAGSESSFYHRLTKGVRHYLATPRLRGLLALHLAVAAGGAMVIVNTVVYVRGLLERGDADVAVALAVSGAGSMLIAFILPRLLVQVSERPLMITGGVGIVAGLVLIGIASMGGPAGWPIVLAIWFLLGLCSSAIATPAGRLLRRSCHPEDRPALFSAQFALSHACWLVTYPAAGWIGAAMGMASASFVLAALAASGIAAALILWPADDPDVVPHLHRGLPADHPHLRDAKRSNRGFKHAHSFVIDDFHRHWPNLR